MTIQAKHGYDTAMLVCDVWKRRRDGVLVCSCYTPGAPVHIEPEYLVRAVKPSELDYHIADGMGRVFVIESDIHGRFVPVAEYISALTQQQICRLCAEIINKREHRTHPYQPIKTPQHASHLHQ